jgi:hypothetical protein
VGTARFAVAHHLRTQMQTAFSTANKGQQRKTSASSFAFLLGMSVSCRHLATVDETADFRFLALRDLPLFASDVPSRRGKLAAGLPDFVAAGRPDSASLATREARGNSEPAMNSLQSEKTGSSVCCC